MAAMASAMATMPARMPHTVPAVFELDAVVMRLSPNLNQIGSVNTLDPIYAKSQIFSNHIQRVIRVYIINDKQLTVLITSLDYELINNISS